MLRTQSALILLLALSISAAALAADLNAQQLAAEFANTVRPFLEDNCTGCHGQDQAKAKLNLNAFSNVAEVERSERTWSRVLERLEAKEMPPDEAKRQPSDAQRQAVIDWIRSLRKSIAAAHAGDPGEVLARRLSNSEYDYTIRDLTGVDIQPTKEFPVDPANEAGFDNTGESLSMSPALLKKYLESARHVSEYIVFNPEGFTFAPFPVVTDTDRDKYCVNRIVQFYQRQPTDLAEYFLAAWRYKYRTSLGMPHGTLAEVAAKAKVSPKYLATVWHALTDSADDVGPIATLHAKWNALPSPGESEPRETPAVLAACKSLRDWVLALREKIQPQFANLILKGVGPGSQPLVLWKDRQYAEHRMTYDRGVLQIDGDPKSGRQVPAQKIDQPEFPSGTEERQKVAMRPAPRDPDLTMPADITQRPQYEAAFQRFAETFPDAFYISERGRIFLDRAKEKQDKGRLLSAGFHSMMGYFRDDRPLYELILDDAGRKVLDELWTELDFITEAPQRQHTGYIWYERAESATIRRWGPEFDEFRSEDKDITSEARLKKFADLYLAKARESYAANGGNAIALEVLDDFFKNVNTKVRWLERTKLAAEPSHLKSLLEFADRAYRRPLTQAERDGLVAFYHQLRDQDGLSHEDAIRDTLASILISPNFCYRIDLVDSANGLQKLPDYALASRLSYFLWSSMPDDELRRHAAADDLHQPEILLTQAKRMIQDGRARALAVEFGGNWLDFRRFQEHNAVDRNRFPQFTNDLRQAMFEEPVRFILNVVQRDQSVLDFLYGDYTFVNPALAKFYGMPAPGAPANEWTRVDGISRYGRGGLPAMAVFLTKNAPGLRTSPVKRGYWVVRRLLGEVIPPPPPNVPVLPTDETQLGELTLPQTMARHRADRNCSVCHEKFDSLGLVFEGYGPIGERREKDLAGRPVENSATFPDGSDGAGLEALQRYLRDKRENDFLDNLCRKLLSYALGRSLIASDEPLVEKMREQLAANDFRFSALIETMITSPQFLTKRGEEAAVKE